MTDTLPADHQPGANNPPSLAAELEERHGLLKVELRKTLELIAKLPAEITTDAEEATAIELQAAVGVITKKIDAAHKTEAEEAAKVKATVDVFFLTRGLKGQITTPKSALDRKVGDWLAKKAAIRQAELDAEAERLRKEADARLAEAAEAEEKGDHTIAEVRQNAAEAVDRAADTAQARANAPVAERARTYSGSGTTSLRQVLDCDPDRATIDLEYLRPYLGIDAIKSAIGQAGRANGWKVADVAKANAAIKGARWTVVNTSGTR